MEERKFHGWPAVVAIVMVAVGAACYVLSCVAAMVIANRGRGD